MAETRPCFTSEWRSALRSVRALGRWPLELLWLVADYVACDPRRVERDLRRCEDAPDAGILSWWDPGWRVAHPRVRFADYGNAADGFGIKGMLNTFFEAPQPVSVTMSRYAVLTEDPDGTTVVVLFRAGARLPVQTLTAELDDIFRSPHRSIGVAIGVALVRVLGEDDEAGVAATRRFVLDLAEHSRTRGRRIETFEICIGSGKLRGTVDLMRFLLFDLPNTAVALHDCPAVRLCLSAAHEVDLARSRQVMKEAGMEVSSNAKWHGARTRLVNRVLLGLDIEPADLWRATSDAPDFSRLCTGCAFVALCAADWKRDGRVDDGRAREIVRQSLPSILVDLPSGHLDGLLASGWAAEKSRRRADQWRAGALVAVGALVAAITLSSVLHRVR